MRKFYYLLMINCLLLWHSAWAQNYWQQEVNYKINVRLDDRNHFLYASEEIEYINNSPDQLSFIWFHLWPNAYKNRNTAFAKQQIESGNTRFYFADEKNRGYIDSLDFSIDGQSVKWEFHPDHPDICKLILNQSLQSGARIIVSTPFRVKLPASFSRLGHVEQSYQITQWYPKPAVYDQKGWHEMPYLDQGEFYSEFGSFDVSITLPKNYVVGATGNLQNPEEIAWLEQKAQATAALKEFPKENAFPASAKQTKTLRYVQDKIHDFAWFADKRYHVLKGQVELPASRRKVDTWVMFTNQNARYWKKAVDYVNNALCYYSLWNGDYPYDQATAVDGALSAGGGMEYPTITVIGGVNSDLTLETVIAHEVGHNWFYGVLGSNERKHAWMDEGLNSFNELRYLETRYPDLKLFDSFAPDLAELAGAENVPQRRQYELLYLLTARRGLDQPMDLPATDFTMLNYAGIVYSKTAMVFNHVRHYLGDEKFDAIMQTYYNTWKFRHPYPEDLRRIFEEQTGKNWSWLFDDLIPTNRKIDYAIGGTPFIKDDLINLEVANKGTVPAPFSISAIREGRIVRTQWYEGFAEDVRPVTFPPGNYDWLIIDAMEVMPDINRSNNNLEIAGGRNNRRPLLQFRPFGNMENSRRTQVFFAPVIGANTTDKFMAGVAFYNSTIPGKKHQYLLMPMFSFGRKDLTGTASLDLNFFPRTGFRKVTLSWLAAAYAGYLKAEPKLTFTIMPKKLKFSPEQSITIRHIFMSLRNSILQAYREDNSTGTLSRYGITSVQYSIRQSNALQGWSISGEAQNKQADFTLLTAEANYQHMYSKSKAFRLRAFIGGFAHHTSNPGPFMLGLSGSLDYLADHVLLDRARISNSLTAFTKQRVPDHGGFRAETGIFTDKSLSSLQAEVDIPILPLSIYGDAGLVFEKESFSENFYSGTGLSVNLFKNILQFHFPLAGSNYTSTAPQDFAEFRRNIRFTLRLNSLNPFRLLDEAVKN
jgi:hypothetical protein